MTLAEFGDMFAVLVFQLRHIDAGHAVIRAYYEGLRDLEPKLLEAAADRLSGTAESFPTISDWRAATEAIRRERLAAQREHLRKAQPLCPVCDDTGWQPVDVVHNGQSLRRMRQCVCRACSAAANS